MLRKLSILVLVAWGVLAAQGCSKRIEGTPEDFGSAKHVFVTFKNGESIDGYVMPKAEVNYGTLDRIYKAKVAAIDADKIVLEDAILIRERREFEIARKRMQTGNLEVAPRIDRVELHRHDIEKVESVVGDKPRSARRIAFWTYTTFVVALILNARL
jgi:hypothetical protein